MDIMYCNKWWLKKRCPVGIYKVEEAYKRHTNGEPYSVVITENNVVKYVLDILKNCVIVRFMNEKILPYLIYEFQVVDKEDIFLKTASYYEYNTEKKEESIIFNFKKNGKIVIERRNFKTNEVEEKEITDDVNGNWDKYPGFGEYDMLLKEER